MQIDIDIIIDSVEEFNADSVEYNLNYRKDGHLYKIKMTIENADE